MTGTQPVAVTQADVDLVWDILGSQEERTVDQMAELVAAHRLASQAALVEALRDIAEAADNEATWWCADRARAALASIEGEG